MKLSALVLLCGPMLLCTAACTKVCAAHVREKTKTEASEASVGVGGTITATQPTADLGLQSSLQVAAAPELRQDTISQADATPSTASADSSGSVVVATQNPPIASQHVPPPAPADEPIEVDHNDGDC